MIKVIECDNRIVTCPICGAKLRYEVEDLREKDSNVLFLSNIKTRYIICPECETEVIISSAYKE